MKTVVVILYVNINQYSIRELKLITTILKIGTSKCSVVYWNVDWFYMLGNIIQCHVILSFDF